MIKYYLEKKKEEIITTIKLFCNDPNNPISDWNEFNAYALLSAREISKKWFLSGKLGYCKLRETFFINLPEGFIKNDLIAKCNELSETYYRYFKNKINFKSLEIRKQIYKKIVNDYYINKKESFNPTQNFSLNLQEYFKNVDRIFFEYHMTFGTIELPCPKCGGKSIYSKLYTPKNNNDITYQVMCTNGCFCIL